MLPTVTALDTAVQTSSKRYVLSKAVCSRNSKLKNRPFRPAEISKMTEDHMFHMNMWFGGAYPPED